MVFKGMQVKGIQGYTRANEVYKVNKGIQGIQE